VTDIGTLSQGHAIPRRLVPSAHVRPLVLVPRVDPIPRLAVASRRHCVIYSVRSHDTIQRQGGLAMFTRHMFTVVALAMLTSAGTIAAPPKSAARLTVTAPDLDHGFPQAYTASAFGCTGKNLSPELAWSGAPAATKSVVVTLYDPDDRNTPSGWWHWVVYDLPASATGLAVGAGIEKGSNLPAGTKQGRTDLGNQAYHGPCPDKGDKPHRYTFTVVALDVAKLEVDDGASGALVTETAREHVIAKGQLVIRHGR
jgi:Raf kinase inhibitor-like YbhB/YbcL family protein